MHALDETLRARLQQVESSSRQLAARGPVELLLATYYSSIVGDPSGLERLEATLAGAAGAHAAVRPWRALIQWARTPPSRRAEPDPHALAGASPFTTLVVGAEIARMFWHEHGPRPAWQWLVPLELLPRASALQPLDELRRDNPLLVSGCCTVLDLSAANGAWKEHQALFQICSPWWATGTPQAVRIALAHVDGCLGRGLYGEALRLAREVGASARGDWRVKQRASLLHALIGLGRAGSDEAVRALCAEARTDGGEAAAEWRMAPDELERTQRLVSSLVSLHPRLTERAGEEGLDTTGTHPAPDADGEALQLLDAERRARLRNNAASNAAARRSDLLELTARAEDLLQRAAVWSEPGISIRLRLLWCRLVAETAPAGALDACRRVLDGVVHEARDLGLVPLEMRALEQRSALWSGLSPSHWEAAVLDATTASRLALELLADNVGSDADDAAPDRSLLESLLPVLDRVVQTYAEGAAWILEDHPELAQPSVPLDESVWNDGGARGKWVRFGRLLQGFAEKEQTLALEEARRSYVDNRTVPMRFVTAPEAPSQLPLEELRTMLRPRDAVLQYLLVGPYLLAFVYGRTFFDWCIERLDTGQSAEQAIAGLVDQASAWTRGQRLDSELDAVTKLQSIVLPKKIDEALRLANVDHLRIVPHGALYRIPFGRVAARGEPLGERHSLSLHVTGRLAARSAVGTDGAAAGGRTLAYISGPEPLESSARQRDAVPSTPPPLRRVAGAAEEEQALRRSVGRLARLARVETVDGTAQPLDAIVRCLESGSHSFFHVTCHGREGGVYRQMPKLLLGCDGTQGLGADRIATLEIGECHLVFLQSCSTGWMTHERSNPVQGIPQAFLDAGARAVIAPLSMVPKALAAPFTAVFYRALRFSSPERALARTLQCFRTHGRLLVGADGDAREDLDRHGGTMDAFEYRFMGATGMRFGNGLSRAIGWLAFHCFEWKLRLQAAKG